MPTPSNLCTFSFPEIPKRGFFLIRVPGLYQNRYFPSWIAEVIPNQAITQRHRLSATSRYDDRADS